MNIWISSLIGEFLKCSPEPTNKEDENAVKITRIDSLGVEVIVGHLPKNISKASSMFLTLPHTSIQTEVVGKRINRGGGYGLEIPVRYNFKGPSKGLKWLLKKIKKVEKELNDCTKKCLK